MSRPLLFVFLISFCAGIAAGELWAVPVMAPAAVAACAIGCLGVRRLRLPIILVLGLSLGAFRVQAALRVEPTDIAHRIGQTVTLRGSIVLPSTTFDTSQRFELTNIFIGRHQQRGKALISVPTIPSVHAGTHVALTCPLVELASTARHRQWSHGIHVRCTTREVTVLDRHVRGWRATLGRWQERLLRATRRRINEPQASLLNGILLGNTDGMTTELQSAFQATGTTHIVALSGFNVTIIITSVITALTQLVGRRWSWIPALLFIAGFVVMTGASASVVRAATMATIVQAGTFLGRPIHPGRLITYAGLLMILVNPLALWHDLGFQLSFLATAGLVFAAERIAARLPMVTDVGGIRESLATTLAAIVATEPLLLWRFGRLSLVAPVVNLLVLPLIPLAMGLGAASLLCDWIPYLDGIVVPPTDAVLRAIIAIIGFGADVPGAMVHLAPVAAIVYGGLSAVLCVRLFTLRHDPAPDRP